MKRQVMRMTVLAVGLIGSQLTGRAADDTKAKTEADIKAISSQLTSDDPQKVQDAIKGIQQSITKDPKNGIPTLVARWNMPLFFAKRYDDIATLTQNAIVLTESPGPQAGDGPVEALAQMRIRALILAGRGEDALAAAKSFYNVVTLKNTSVAIDFVVQALAVARKDQPGLGKKFRLQQIESTSTNATLEGAGKVPSMLADVKVDSKPYEAAMNEQLNVDNLTSANLQMLGNLYLLADQPKKAEDIYRRIYDIAESGDLVNAIEGIARSLRAQDGNLARANTFIIAERNKTQ